MLVAEVAEVAEFEIVAEDSSAGIKARLLWRKETTQRISYSNMNSNNQVSTQTETVKQKRKVTGKKKARLPMIRCKTFVFKPSNNGIVNFSYKSMLDEEIVKEAERVFDEEEEEEEVKKKNDADDERNQKKRKEPSSNDSTSAVVVVPPKPHQQQNNNQQQDQLVKRPISVPKIRRIGAPSLPPIPEETPSEMDAAERERWFFEEFCGGVLPPPEELDDWSEPGSKDDAVDLKEEEKKTLRAQLEEISKLGCRKVYDANGKKTIILTKEAQEKLLQSKELRDYVRKFREAERDKGNKLKFSVVAEKDDVGTANSASKSASSPLVVNGSVTVVDIKDESITPPETPKTNEVHKPLSDEKEKDVVIDEEKGKIERPKVDLSSFKRPRRS